MSQFENFKIDRIIFHKIFRRNEHGIVTPFFNQQCENLKAEERTTIEERVIKAVGNHSKAIQMDIADSQDGSVFKYVSPLFSKEYSDDEFIDMSLALTNKLVEAQSTRRMPGGVVVIFEGTTGLHSEKFLGIIKAEEDNGFTLESIESRMMLKYISDLLLTKNQKIYKVAMMIDKGTGSSLRKPEEIAVYIYDSNNNVARADSKATYFYDAFMGCAFQRSSEILTRDFYNLTKTYINTAPQLTSEDKIDLAGALNSYLKFNISPEINTAEFAETYIKAAEVKDGYAKFMEEKDIPVNNFRKDLSLISKRTNTRKIHFTNSITLEAPADGFHDFVSIKENEDNSTTIIIKAKRSSEE